MSDVDLDQVARHIPTDRERLLVPWVIMPPGVLDGAARSGVQRWTLGSVTETIVRHAHHSVLVLRAAT